MLADPNYIFSKEVGDFVDSQLIDYLPDDEIPMPYRIRQRRGKHFVKGDDWAFGEEDTHHYIVEETIDSVDDPHYTNTMLKQMGSGSSSSSSSSRTIGGNVIGMKQRRLASEKIPTKLKLEDFREDRVELKPEFAHLEGDTEHLDEEDVEKYYHIVEGGEIDYDAHHKAKDVEIEGNIKSVAKHRLADILSTKTGKARERGLRADYGYTQTQWKQKKEFEAMISKGNIAEAVAKTANNPPPPMLGTITPLAVSHSIEPNLQPILKQEFYTDKEGKKYDKKLFKPKMIKGKGIKYFKR